MGWEGVKFNEKLIAWLLQINTYYFINRDWTDNCAKSIILSMFIAGIKNTIAEVIAVEIKEKFNLYVHL